MTNGRRLTIGILSGYQVYGNLSDSQTIEGNSISDYLLRVHQGIVNAGKDFDCNILIGCGLGSPPSPEHPYPAWFNWSNDATFVPVGPWNTDGLIVLAPVISVQRQKLLRELRSGGFPIIFCGTGEPPAVIANDAEGIREAVMHLHTHGHRQIAYIAGYENIEGDSATRLAAYQAAMLEFGLGEHPELISYGYHTIRGGKDAMQKLLASGQRFSAVVTSDYSSAMGALRALHSADLRVPEDVALIGFDDYLDARAQTPPVTTVHTQLSEMGYQAVKLLLEYINAQRSEPVTHSVKGQLVIRRSCGCTTQNNRPDGEVLPITDAEIARRMAEVALRGAYHLQFDETQTGFTRLIRAFRISLRETGDGSFTTVLASLLELVADRDDDTYILQDAITVLRQNIRSSPDTTLFMESGALIETLLDEARLRISEYSRGQATRALIHRVNIRDALDAMTSRLLSALDEAEISGILTEHLPRIGIAHAEIVTLEQEDDDPTAWSQLWRQPHHVGHQKQRFPTRQFPPVGLYPAEKAYQSVILPLVCRQEQVGYIAFFTDDLEPLAAIAQHVSAAIASARLYKEAQTGQRLAESANQLKTRFLSTVSHELRTPLNLIVGLSELLLHEQQHGKPPARQDLERIYASSRHLGFLIRDVLDLASSDAGQLRLALEPINLNDVLQLVCAIGEQLTAEKGLAWSAALPEPGARVLGDRVRLHQILLNLISNAVKFTPKGGVTLTAMNNESQVTVSVTDTGLGIPLEEQGNIFDEFHQSERTASRGFGGMGLGLAISKHLVKLHSGNIGVRSSGVEGEGATLFFTLPLLEQPIPKISPLLYFDVLLLTNQMLQAAPLREYLAGQGYNVFIHAFDPQMDWLERTISNPPAAILLDQSLAEIYGWSTLESLRRNPKLQNIPVLFYNLPEGDKKGAVFEFDYQTKPLPLDNLPAILAHSPQTILLVDDDQNILDLHTRMLQMQQPECRIIHTHNGREALEILSSLRPDLILLDLMMPELDGFGVLKALQANESNRKIPVVVLTNKVLTEQDMDRLNRGVAAILEKGVFTNEETLACISAVLTHSHRATSASQQLARKAMAYIHSHYADPLSRDVIAAYLAVSENYLTNCFQKEIGVSPLAYANRYRVHQARSLLGETNITITEVALSVGFSDLSHFSRVFRKETGFSPLAYRRNSFAAKPG